MVIENVLVATNLTTRWRIKADTEVVSFHDAKLIWERRRFKPHLLIDVMCLVLLKDLSVQRRQVLLVKVARH